MRIHCDACAQRSRGVVASFKYYMVDVGFLKGVRSYQSSHAGTHDDNAEGILVDGVSIRCFECSLADRLRSDFLLFLYTWASTGQVSERLPETKAV